MLIYLIIALFPVVLIIRAWLQFAALTTSLIQAYASGTHTSGLDLFADWLIYPRISSPLNKTSRSNTAAATTAIADAPEEEVEEEVVDVYEAESTIMHGILQPLGFAWGILLIMPVLLTIILTLFQ